MIPWLLCGLGTLVCLAGVYVFFRNIYEEGRSLKWAFLLMVIGVLFIAAGTAKYVGLMK